MTSAIHGILAGYDGSPDSERALRWLRSNYELPSFRTFDPRSAPPPRAYLDAVWGFHLRPAPGGTTRLVVRTRGRGPRAFTWPFDLLNDPRHFVMQNLQFRNLRIRVGTHV